MRPISVGGAKAVFTSRSGGVSKAAFATLNTGMHVGDDPQAVRRNRDLLEAKIDRTIVWMNQTHSARVHKVEPGRTDQVVNSDGIFVVAEEFASKHLRLPALAVMVADCVPVVFASSGGEVMGAVHAGRAGLSTGIIRKAVSMMSEHVPAYSIHAAVGPCICGRCYEVPEKLRADLAEVTPSAWCVTRWGSPGLDVRASANSQLQEAGVQVDFISKLCTYEDENLYSYRRNQITGRFCGVVFPA